MPVSTAVTSQETAETFTGSVQLPVVSDVLSRTCGAPNRLARPNRANAQSDEGRQARTVSRDCESALGF